MSAALTETMPQAGRQGTTTLRQLADAIAAPRALCEETFLAAGQDLQEAVNILQRLTGTFESLLADLEGEDVELASRDISQAASSITTLSGSFKEESRTLSDLTAGTAGIHERVKRMFEAVKAAQALGMNAKVEAHHLSEISEDFHGFADEIDRSLKLAKSNIDKLRHEVGEVLGHLEQANSKDRTFGAQYAETLELIPKRLAYSVETLAARHDQAVAGAGAVAECSQRVARRVSEAVMALQVGDIARQRIEHVEDAITLLEAVAGGEDGWRELDEAGRDRLLALGYRVQSEQLADTADELKREAGRILASLEELQGSTAEIAGLGVNTYGGSDVSESTFLAGLEHDLDQARELMQGFVAARHEADNIVNAVGDAANRLLDQIDEIQSLEVDIRITGLNASFKCRRVGDVGLPLSIIAQELRACAYATAEEAGGMLSSLDEMKTLLTSLSDSRRSERASEISTVTDAITDSVARIGGVGGQLAEALNGLKADSGEVTTFLQTAMERLHADVRIVEPLRSASADLADLASTVPVAGDAADDPIFEDVRARLLDQFAANYTMAQERDVLYRVTGTGGASPATSETQQPDAEDECDLDDFLF